MHVNLLHVPLLIEAASPPESPSSHLHEQLRDRVRPNCTYCHFMFPFRAYCHLMLQARRTAGAKATEVKGLTSAALPFYASTDCHFTLQVTGGGGGPRRRRRRHRCCCVG